MAKVAGGALRRGNRVKKSSPSRGGRRWSITGRESSFFAPMLGDILFKKEQGGQVFELWEYDI